MSKHIPDPAVKRLTLYLRRLEQLETEDVDKVSSRELGQSLLLRPEQVRKDLAYFGQFGRAGVGYLVQPLAESLRRILNVDRTQKVVVVGAGDLGRALLRHGGFLKKNFDLVGAFDIDPAKVGHTIGRVLVYDMSELPDIVRSSRAHLGVITVPAEAAQGVCDALCHAGVRGLLNFAPITIRTPPGVAVRDVDLAARLEQLSFDLGRSVVSGPSLRR